MVNKNPLLVNTHDACELIGCKRTKLFQLLRDGQLEKRKLGRLTVIPYHSLASFAEKQAP